MTDSPQTHELLTFPVPPGYAPMSMPCDPLTRLKPQKDFVLIKAEERHLIPFVRGLVCITTLLYCRDC